MQRQCAVRSPGIPATGAGGQCNVGGDASGAWCHHQQGVGQIGAFANAVGDEDHGEAFLIGRVLPQPQQIVIQRGARWFIERGERLVQQQQPGPGYQRAGNGYPHLHPAGQFAGIGAFEAAKADAGECRGGARVSFGARYMLKVQRQAHIALRVGPRHPSGVLEDEADGRLSVRPCDGAGVGRHEARDQAQRGGLAAARRSQQRDEFAIGDAEGQVAQGFGAALFPSRAEAFGDG